MWGPDAPELLDGKGFESGRYGRLVDPPETIGFREVARKLGHEDVRSYADGAGKAELGFHRDLDALGQLDRSAEEVVRAGDIEKNLVYGVGLRLGSKPEADLLQLLAGFRILPVIPDDEDDLGAEPLCLIGRHTRLHAICPGLVRSGRDDSPLSGARDGYRLAPELGVVQLLDGSEVRIHVDADDYLRHVHILPGLSFGSKEQSIIEHHVLSPGHWV